MTKSNMTEIPRRMRPRKYLIWDKVYDRPVKQIPFLLNLLADDLQFSRDHLNKVINYRIGDRSALNTDQLQIIARRLNCSPQSLLNHDN